MLPMLVALGLGIGEFGRALQHHHAMNKGMRDAALTCWELAEARLRALEMNGYAAATRRCLGLALGGEQGRALVAEAGGQRLRHIR